MLTLNLSNRIDLDGIPQTEGFDNYRFGGLFSGFGAGNGMGGVVALDDRFVFSTMYNGSLTGAYTNGWTALSGAGQQLLPWMELDPDFELFIQNVFWDPAQQTYNFHINNRNTAETDIVEYDLLGDQVSVTSLQEVVVERLIPDPKSNPQPGDETDLRTNFISFGGFHDTATTSTGDFITMSALFNTGVKIVMPVLYNAQGGPIGAGTLIELEDDYISGFSQAPLDIHRIEASGGVVHLIYSGRGSSNLYHLTMDEAGNTLGTTQILNVSDHPQAEWRALDTSVLANGNIAVMWSNTPEDGDFLNSRTYITVLASDGRIVIPETEVLRDIASDAEALVITGAHIQTLANGDVAILGQATFRRPDNGFLVDFTYDFATTFNEDFTETSGTYLAAEDRGFGPDSHNLATGRAVLADGSGVFLDQYGHGRFFDLGGLETAYGAGTEFVSPIDGSAEADALSGGVSSDLIAGFGGNDVINGNEGNDRLDGGDGDDTLDGGRGNDNLTGGAGREDAKGGTGNDKINGGDDADFLRGGTGRDTLRGDNGQDALRGQKDGDLLFGGAGDDNLKGGGGNDTLFGDAGDDFLKGGSREDQIFGGTGDDRLLGNSFDDLLSGGGGNDRLIAGGGDDTLQGGRGDDFLRGGAGADVFVFDLNGGADTFDDFDLQTDRLEIGEYGLSAQQIEDRAQASGGDLLIEFTDADSILMRGVTSADGLAELISFL